MLLLRLAARPHRVRLGTTSTGPAAMPGDTSADGAAPPRRSRSSGASTVHRPPYGATGAPNARVISAVMPLATQDMIPRPLRLPPRLTRPPPRMVNGVSTALPGHVGSVLPLRHRMFPWLLVLTFALMPLAWRSPGATPLGVIRYVHGPAVLVILLASGRVALARKIRALVVACTVYTLLYATFSWYHAAPPFALQQALYIATAFMVAARLRNATGHDWKVLRWAGPATVLTFMVVFLSDARAAGVDVIAAYGEAIASGNLNLVQYLFYQVFNAHLPSGATAVSPAARHEVLAAVLVAVYFSVYASTMVRSNRKFFACAHWASITVAAMLIALSLSRSVLLAAIVACALPVARVVVGRSARPATISAICLAGAILAVGITSPFARLIWDRLNTDTTSYSARAGAASAVVDAIISSPLIGSNPFVRGIRPEDSAHNFFLDATRMGGVLTGIAALAILFTIYRDWFAGFRAYMLDRRFFAPLAAALVGIVFMFTAGTGTLNLPEWMGFSLLYAALTASKDARSASLPGHRHPAHPWTTAPVSPGKH